MRNWYTAEADGLAKYDEMLDALARDWAIVEEVSRDDQAPSLRERFLGLFRREEDSYDRETIENLVVGEFIVESDLMGSGYAVWETPARSRGGDF